MPHEDKLIIGCGWEGLPAIFNVITGKAVVPNTEENVKKQQVTCIGMYARR